MFYFSSEVVDKKIEEFLSSFEEKIENLTEDAFNTQVIVLAWSFVGSPKPSIGEGNGTPLQYSCWEIPWMEEPVRLQSMGLQRVGHD